VVDTRLPSVWSRHPPLDKRRLLSATRCAWLKPFALLAVPWSRVSSAKGPRAATTAADCAAWAGSAFAGRSAFAVGRAAAPLFAEACAVLNAVDAALNSPRAWAAAFDAAVYADWLFGLGLCCHVACAESLCVLVASRTAFLASYVACAAALAAIAD